MTAMTDAETVPQAEPAESPVQEVAASPLPEPAAHPLVAVKAAAAAPAEPWRRRALRALLYGSKVDRNVKARARVGLAILAFAVVYFIIAVRLIAFGIISDSRSAHRVGGGDAIATARPDILDRNGEVLATDVRVPSLYA